MHPPLHDPDELDALRAFTVPTLANAIETFGVIPANAGACDATLRCHTPELPLLLGYAVTARVSTDQPPSAVRPAISEPDYWRFLAGRAGPRVAVVQDIDRPPRGAMWGEWNANVHKALGCVGMVTEGAVRDLAALHRLRFHAFSTQVLPSHAYGAFIDYGGIVRVAGLTIASGDLLAGDEHGVILIPPEIPLRELARVAAEIDRLEAEIFALCQSPGFSLERLIALDADVARRWPSPGGSAARLRPA